MKNFNSRFDRVFNRSSDLSFRFFVILIVLVQFGVLGGAGYVAWHFISKYW
jgi:flagellar basal body-associated protein FliL